MNRDRSRFADDPYERDHGNRRQHLLDSFHCTRAFHVNIRRSVGIQEEWDVQASVSTRLCLIGCLTRRESLGVRWWICYVLARQVAVSLPEYMTMSIHRQSALVRAVVSAAFIIVAGCSEEPRPVAKTETAEEIEDRADYLQRAIGLESLMVEKLKLARPESLTDQELQQLEMAYNELTAGKLVGSFDLEYGVARVDYSQWAALDRHRKVGIVGLLSEYRFAKVGAQFVSVRRETGPAEVASAGINGVEVYR